MTYERDDCTNSSFDDKLLHTYISQKHWYTLYRMVNNELDASHSSPFPPEPSKQLFFSPRVAFDRTRAQNQHFYPLFKFKKIFEKKLGSKWKRPTRSTSRRLKEGISFQRLQDLSLSLALSLSLWFKTFLKAKNHLTSKGQWRKRQWKYRSKFEFFLYPFFQSDLFFSNLKFYASFSFQAPFNRRQ